MRRPLLILATALVLVVAPPVRAQDLLAEDLLFDRFAAYVESLRVQAGIPGLAAAIVGNNDILWERAFGRQDLERSMATRTDTPFHLDGVTQVFTASLVLRCVEEGRLSLDDYIGKFRPSSADASATIRQVLSHTSGSPDHLVFAYRPERLAPLTVAVRSCGDSFRETLGNTLERLAMVDSVPGPDIVHLVPPAEGIPSPEAVQRYAAALERLATPYSVDSKGHATLSRYEASTLTPAGGLISTVQDFAQFFLALRKGVLLRPETLALAWQAPIGADGQRLPHGLGWFVQSYNGEAIVWQFGVEENASSSLVVTVPTRGLTLILLANSSGLVKPFPLTAGDVTVSPFARIFFGLFVR
jgi:CubicO group peptidase (beta-lactamase class C family)